MKKARAFIGLVCWGLVLAGVQAGVAPKAPVLIEPFGFQGVRLGDGRLRDQVEDIKNDYLAIPDDDLLKGFRTRAGLPAPGNDLGGWYSDDSFNIFGQIISGLSRLFAATGDPACKAKVDALLSGWSKCIGPDGYFYYSMKPNAFHYTYDKMVGGLVDAYLYCGNTSAIEDLGRITNWAVAHLDRTREYANTRNSSCEWYTLTENLYRAYLATGDTKYRDFGAVWEYPDYWGIFARKGDVFGDYKGNYHAYSHVNTLGGAAAAYLVSGERRYLDTLINAYDFLTTRQTFATGGFGPEEKLQRGRGDLVRSLGAGIHHFETQCGSWAVFKLAKSLLRFTGDARFGDWIELMIFNGIGASNPTRPAGTVQYYSNYRLYGASKANDMGPWTCCAGTRPMAAADYSDLIWFKDASNLYVNLYTPSTVRWSPAGAGIEIAQKGALESGAGIVFTVALGFPAAFGIKFRVPGWIAGPMTVSVNGTAFPAVPDEKRWLTVRRTWKDGDRIVLRLPMELRAQLLDPEGTSPAMVLFGPIALAGPLSGREKASLLDQKSLPSLFEPLPSSPATFRLKTDPAVILRPFYTFEPGEEYFMYFDPRMADIDPTAFSGAWETEYRFRFSDDPGAAAEASFVGTGIVWTGFAFDDAGKAEVSIDGRVVGVADQYGPAREAPFEWRHQGLPPGRHVIRIQVLPDKNPLSKGRFINIHALAPLAKTS